MPNTTNNNWPTPADTDLVKNGADAIRDLGNAIDTTLGVYVPSTPGLTLINTTSFSAVASQSINDVFSATYDNYRVVMNISQSAAVGLAFRVRVAGADLTTATYKWSRYFNFSNDGAYASSIDNTASSIDVPGGMADRGFFVFDIGNPFNAFNTHVQERASFINSSAHSYNFTVSGSVNNTTSYTGFTIFPGSGTFTGTISVYGVAK
jgi:hypothetical protein